MTLHLDQITIGQAKELAALFGGAQQQQQQQAQPGLPTLVGKKCVVRTYSAGVWFGEVAEKAGNEVIVKNARRLWRWHAVDGICLSAVSQYGIHRDKSRISAPVPSVWLEAIEMIPASDTAIDSIEGATHANAE